MFKDKKKDNSNSQYKNDIDIFRKMLLYRSEYRGCKETDLIIGSFAKKYINSMSYSDLCEFQKIIQCNDYDIYNWVVKKHTIPDKYDNKISNMLKYFVQKHFLE